MNQKVNELQTKLETVDKLDNFENMNENNNEIEEEEGNEDWEKGWK